MSDAPRPTSILFGANLRSFSFENSESHPMIKKAKSTNSNSAAASNSDQDPLASNLLDALFKSALKELEKELEEGPDGAKEVPTKKSRKDGAGIKARTEIHISGRIDSFVFGAIKDAYFEEYINSHVVLKDGDKNKDFLEKMFSLFLENSPFSNKSNLEIFNDSIDLKKFKKVCPRFYSIYKTVLTGDYEKKQLVTKDGDVYLKTTAVRSTKYNHYSFLKEIMDSPNFLNPLRVFSTDNFIEIFTSEQKFQEGQLDQFLELKKVDQDEDFDDEGEFKYSPQQSDLLNKFDQGGYRFPDLGLHPIAISKQGSLQLDGFWPIDFFKIALGDSSELYEGLYSVIRNHYQYKKDREIRLVFSNVSRCVFTIAEKLEFEKLMLLRCGMEEELRLDAINYSDDINLFNYLAYDGSLLTPKETIFRDKGITIETTYIEGGEDQQPSFCSLFID